MTDFLQSPYSYNKTVSRGIKILELLSEQGILSDREIARRLSYNLATVRHILNSYLNLGYLIRDEENRYDLSIKIFDIGQKFKQRRDLKDIAHPYMQRLVHTFNETVLLGTLDSPHIVYLDKIDSFEMLRFSPQEGQQVTAHHTALGKAILAHLPDDKLKHYCLNASWRPYTPKSIDSIDKLIVRLPRIKKQGFAISDEEYCMGSRAIAVPILDHKGFPRFAVSIWGPVNRMVPSVLREMHHELSEICEDISRYCSASHESQAVTGLGSLPQFIPPSGSKPKKTGIFERTLAMFF